MKYDAIVIGAGAGGLSAALKLSCLGKKVLVLEKLPKPGGFGTSFKRKDFIFESSLHCVDGLEKGGEIRKFLEECGVDKQLNFISLKDFARTIYPEHDFTSHFDPVEFEGLLKDRFPHEKYGLTRLFRAMGKFYKRFDKLFGSDLPVWLQLFIRPFTIFAIARVSMLTADKFLSRYIEDAKLKSIIADIWRFMGLAPGRLSALYFLIVLRGYYFEKTSYIKGGYSKIFFAMVERLKETGSEIKFNCEVVAIRLESGRVKSVVTKDGSEFNARVVISNASALDTLTKLIDDNALKEEYRRQLLPQEKSLSAFQVYLGLDVPARELGMSCFLYSINTTYDHDASFNYCLNSDYENCSLELVDHSQLEHGLVPEGKGALVIMTLDNYSGWSALSQDEYKRRKEEVASKLIARTEKYLAGLSRHIETMVAATPITMARYASSPEGAIYGFAQTVSQSSLKRLSQGTKIKGLILCGAWTRPGGGVHACFISGIKAGELALKAI